MLLGGGAETDAALLTAAHSLSLPTRYFRTLANKGKCRVNVTSENKTVSKD